MSERGNIFPYTLVVIAIIALLSAAALTSLQGLQSRNQAVRQQLDYEFAVREQEAIVLYNAIALNPDAGLWSGEMSSTCWRRDENSLISAPLANIAELARLGMRVEADVPPARLLESLRDYMDPDSAPLEQGGEDVRYARLGRRGPSNQLLRSVQELNEVLGWSELDWTRFLPVAETELTVHAEPSFAINESSGFGLQVKLGVPESDAEALAARLNSQPVTTTPELNLFVPQSQGIVDGPFSPAFSFMPSAKFSVFSTDEGFRFGRRVVYEIVPNGIEAPFRRLDSFALSAASLQRMRAWQESNDSTNRNMAWRCFR